MKYGQTLPNFLKAVIQVVNWKGLSRKILVCDALHPNDPVSQTSHGSDQIMASVAGLKRTDYHHRRKLGDVLISKFDVRLPFPKSV